MCLQFKTFIIYWVLFHYVAINSWNYKKNLNFLIKTHCFFIPEKFWKNMFLSFHNLKKNKYACFIYKDLHRLAPHPLKEFINQKSDCEVAQGPPLEGSVGQSVGAQHLVNTGAKCWNGLPKATKERSTYTEFEAHIKVMVNQVCAHWVQMCRSTWMTLSSLNMVERIQV